jgi:hypothetical protein
MSHVAVSLNTNIPVMQMDWGLCIILDAVRFVRIGEKKHVWMQASIQVVWLM